MAVKEELEWMASNYGRLADDLTCQRAAQAMAIVLAAIRPGLEVEDLRALRTIGAVLFREGLREVETGHIAARAIARARGTL